MSKGLPRDIIKQYGVSKKAWEVFRSRKGSQKVSRKGRCKVARSRAIRVYSGGSRRAVRRRSQTTMPIAVVGGLAAGLITPAQFAMAGDFNSAGRLLVSSYTGYDMGTGQFNMANLRMGLAPLLVGFLVHTAASKLGINRALGRARIPFVRV